MTSAPHTPTADGRPRLEAGHHAFRPAPVRPGAVLVPFPASGARRRRAPAADERRGEILLFLGVRYERLAS